MFNKLQTEVFWDTFTLHLWAFHAPIQLTYAFMRWYTCDIISDFAPEFDIIGEYTSSNTQLVWQNQFLTL